MPSRAMDHRSSSSHEGEPSICLQILEQGNQDQLSSHCGGTIFEHQREFSDKVEKKDNRIIKSVDVEPAKKLTLVALRLALFEKSASELGTLGFIWATVVLLGGFAVTLEKTDFWLITTILLIEGARIFSRRNELEWQHQATWSLIDAGKFHFQSLRSSSNFLFRTLQEIFRPTRTIGEEPKPAEKALQRNFNSSLETTWLTPEAPPLPYTNWVFLSKKISKLLYWLQLMSAFVSVCLSLMRLIQQSYGEIYNGESEKKNRKSALNIFYALALAEALLFLMEKAYFEWNISYCKLLEQVNTDCGFGNSGLVSIRRFFYDAYSRSVNGSIFDGLNMNLVSFATELLKSDSCDEQTTGVRILRNFVTNKRFSDDTLRKIGASTAVMERLVEMLNWKKPPEEEIRKSAAKILSKLAGKGQNSHRVSRIPGAMESISSLLYTGQKPSTVADEISQNSIVTDKETYKFSSFTYLGLLILEKLARDRESCGRIGSARGLLQKIIYFTRAGEKLLKGNYAEESQIMAVQQSLQLVKTLVDTTGPNGKILRQEIFEIVFTISNIREILQYGENHPMLQKLGIKIITRLALEADAKEGIGHTGGLLKELVCIFFMQKPPENQNSVRIAAGEALEMLALKSEKNCDQILRLEVVEKFVEALKDPVLQINSARILQNLCVYSGPACFHRLQGISAAAPTVLKAIMSEENKLQEVAIGLAAQVLRITCSHKPDVESEQSTISGTKIVAKLVQILNKYKFPSTEVPRIRRYAIELVIWMMKVNKKSIQSFKDLGMEKELKNVATTTTELECFYMFSGSTGLCRHSTTIHLLVNSALELLTTA